MEKKQETNQVNSAVSPEKFSRGKADLLWVSEGVLVPWSRSSGTGDQGHEGGQETEVATVPPSPRQGSSSAAVDSTVGSQLRSPGLPLHSQPFSAHSVVQHSSFLFLLSLNYSLQILSVLILFYLQHVTIFCPA